MKIHGVQKDRFVQVPIEKFNIVDLTGSSLRTFGVRGTCLEQEYRMKDIALHSWTKVQWKSKRCLFFFSPLCYYFIDPNMLVLLSTPPLSCYDAMLGKHEASCLLRFKGKLRSFLRLAFRFWKRFDRERGGPSSSQIRFFFFPCSDAQNPGLDQKPFFANQPFCIITVRLYLIVRTRIRIE